MAAPGKRSGQEPFDFSVARAPVLFGGPLDIRMQLIRDADGELSRATTMQPFRLQTKLMGYHRTRDTWRAAAPPAEALASERSDQTGHLSRWRAPKAAFARWIEA
jgi:hypothetical protein